MIINVFTSTRETIKISISDSCYERCESYINEYERYLSDCDLNNDDDLNNATIESGKIRGRVTAYLLALYDLGIMSYYDNAELRRYYSDKITILYESWIEG